MSSAVRMLGIGPPARVHTGPLSRLGIGPSARVQTSPLSRLGIGPPARTAHDLALAALIGGNLFGRVAMHPALTDVSDQTERGRVLNRAWRRYGTVNSLALLTLVSVRLAERRHESSQGRSRWRRAPKPAQRVSAQDIAIGAVVLTGLVSALGGVGFAQQAPAGAVPMRSGSRAAPDASESAAKLKRAVNALGALNLASELALVVVGHANGRA